MRTLRAIIAAATRPTIVDVLVNGNPALADAAAAALPDEAPGSTRLRVWRIALGDKAHCWNEYVHRVWPGGETAFFVDGYARVHPQALQALAVALSRSPQSLGASGMPTVGRSARALRDAMAREGGIHGNLFALPGTTMRALRDTGFRLPLGVYRTDPILAAALAFALEPERHDWDLKSRVVVAPDASWDVDEKRWWRWSDLRAQWRRLRRQAQGALENRAVSDWMDHRRRRPQDLPPTAAELVARWAHESPQAFAEALKRDRRLRRAWQDLQEPRDWSAAAIRPELVVEQAG